MGRQSRHGYRELLTGEARRLPEDEFEQLIWQLETLADLTIDLCLQPAQEQALDSASAESDRAQAQIEALMEAMDIRSSEAARLVALNRQLQSGGTSG